MSEIFSGIEARLSTPEHYQAKARLQDALRPPLWVGKFAGALDERAAALSEIGRYTPEQINIALQKIHIREYGDPRLLSDEFLEDVAIVIADKAEDSDFPRYLKDEPVYYEIEDDLLKDPAVQEAYSKLESDDYEAEVKSLMDDLIRNSANFELIKSFSECIEDVTGERPLTKDEKRAKLLLAQSAIFESNAVDLKNPRSSNNFHIAIRQFLTYEQQLDEEVKNGKELNTGNLSQDAFAKADAWRRARMAIYAKEDFFNSEYNGFSEFIDSLDSEALSIIDRFYARVFAALSKKIRKLQLGMNL